MPYVMENRNDAYVSVSDLGDLGAEISPANVSAIKAAVRKLQGIVRAGTDGKWGSSTQAKFVAFVKAKVPVLVASIPEGSISPMVHGLAPLQQAGMSVLEIANANVGWMCYSKPSALANCSILKDGVTSVTPTPSDEWMTGAGEGGITSPPVAEPGFFDKYWWLIAVGALGVGGLVFWKMRQKRQVEDVVGKVRKQTALDDETVIAPVKGW